MPGAQDPTKWVGGGMGNRRNNEVMGDRARPGSIRSHSKDFWF